MKYILLAYADRAAWAIPDAAGDADRTAFEPLLRLGQDLAATGELIYAAGLSDPTYTTRVRRHGGLVVAMDGPDIEPEESLACVHVVDCASHDRAVEIARRLVAGTGETIELRPLYDGGNGYDPASGEASSA